MDWLLDRHDLARLRDFLDLGNYLVRVLVFVMITASRVGLFPALFSLWRKSQIDTFETVSNNEKPWPIPCY